MALLRIIAGAVVGYMLSAASSVAWFSGTHRRAIDPAPVAFMIGTAMFGIFCSVLFGYFAGLMGDSPRAGHGVAILIVLASVAALIVGGEHLTLRGSWASIISLFLMAPAAWVGGNLNRPTQARA